MGGTGLGEQGFLLMAVERKYSDKQLDDVKKRYNGKLNSLGEGVNDPYPFSSTITTDDMPTIEYPDIYNFLINTPSPYTKEELKSLEGYKYLVAGWVGDVSVH